MDIISVVAMLAVVIVALVYAVLPEHWVPYVTMAHSGRWKESRLLPAAALGMVFHVVATLGMGTIVSIFGLAIVSVAGRYTDSFAGVLVVMMGAGVAWRARSHKGGNKNNSVEQFLTAFRAARADSSFGNGKASVLPTLNPDHRRPYLLYVGNLLLSPAVAILPLFVMVSATGEKPGIGHIVPLAVAYGLATAVGLVLNMFWISKSERTLPYDRLQEQFPSLAGVAIMVVGLSGILLGAAS